jgi:hypothetical protein
MHRLFDHYDGELPLLDGFIDDSWRNDVCPSLLNEKLNLKLWVDYVNPDRREAGGKRYTLCAYNNNADEYSELFASESLAEMKGFINEKY